MTIVARPRYADVVAGLGLLDKLAGFDPRIAGTPPLGLDGPASDIDVLCHAPDPDAFASQVWAMFSHQKDFRIRQWVLSGRPVIASFHEQGWPVEIFGSALPVEAQPGWRHFTVEKRLLALGGAGFHAAVRAARDAGAKTEPAFAILLGLPGDPYQALIDLTGLPDSALAIRLNDAGFPTTDQ